MVQDVKQQKSTRHAWKPGESGNPHGRPVNPEAEILRNALEVAKKKHKGLHLIQHAVDHAYVNEQLCVAILKKILPDKIETDFKQDFEIKLNVIKKYPGSKAITDDKATCDCTPDLRIMPVMSNLTPAKNRILLKVGKNGK